MHLVILTLCFTVTTTTKRHVANSVEPFCENPPVYDVSNWANKLHLQRCVFVEIGQGHFSLFVESTEAKSVIREYFLGICEKDIVMKWRLCNTVLEDLRPDDCTFNSDFIENGIRVHRKLCDISNLAYYAEPCGCDTTLADRVKYKVSGFPTCFLNPLPDTICSPLNVCGLHSCNTSTTVGKIHMATCNPNCLGKQPFCEVGEHQIGHLLKISSFWTDWNNLLCSEPSCSTGLLYMEATCINSETGAGAVDCLGPGTNCCPRNVPKCKCNTYMENGVLKVYRIYVNSLWNHTEKRFSRRTKRNVAADSDEKFLKRMFKIVGAKRKHNKRTDEKETGDYDDDEEDDDDTGGEDIAIEENMDEEKSSSTTESFEKGEMKAKMIENEAAMKSGNATPLGDENEEIAQNKCGELKSILFWRSTVLLLTILILKEICI